MGDTWLYHITCERDLVVAVVHKLNDDHKQYDVAAKKANTI